MTTARSLFALVCAFRLAWPGAAAAEHISTYWRLEPVDPRPPATVQLKEPFFTERVLPIGLVALTEPVTIGAQSLPAGTLLFKVFNDEGRTGYCPARKPGLTAMKLLSVPILDQHACFVDSDQDGRFDKVFYTWEQSNGLPTLRGSIDGAKPLDRPVSYRQADVHDYPEDLRVSFVVRGPSSPEKIFLEFHFSRNLGTRWQAPRRAVVDGIANFQVMNVLIAVTSVEDHAAHIGVVWDKDLCVTSDWFGDIIWTRLPSAAFAS